MLQFSEMPQYGRFSTSELWLHILKFSLPMMHNLADLDKNLIEMYMGTLLPEDSPLKYEFVHDLIGMLQCSSQ